MALLHKTLPAIHYAIYVQVFFKSLFIR